MIDVDSLPDNRVSHDYRRLIHAFSARTVAAFPGNLRSIVLSGSHARGEAREGSDIDLWCVFETLSPAILQEVGAITRSLPHAAATVELNSQCVTAAEIDAPAFGHAIQPLILSLEGIPVFGDKPRFPASAETIAACWQSILAEVLLSIRHYLSVAEPAENLTHEKLRRWVLKPLLFGLRIYVYGRTAHYPISLAQLDESLDADQRIVVAYFLDALRWQRDSTGNAAGCLVRLHEIVAGILQGEEVRSCLQP